MIGGIAADLLGVRPAIALVAGLDPPSRGLVVAFDMYETHPATARA